MSIIARPLPFRRLSIPELLNSDNSDDTSSDISTTPSSPTDFTNSIDPSTDFKIKLSPPPQQQHQQHDMVIFPTIIAIKSLPVLKVARRHHHSLKNARKSSFAKPKTQGRPFTSKLNIQFYAHDNMNDLICFLLKMPNCKLIQFDHLSHIDKSHLPTIVKNFDILTHDGPALTSILSKIFTNSLQSTVISNNIFNKDNMEITGGTTTLRKTIIYEPYSDFDNLHSVVQLGLNLQDFKFIRVIRSNGGRLIKLETVESPDYHDTEWFKKNVCFPRYKSGMKIHVIKYSSSIPVIIYNDLRVLYWDLEHCGLDYFMNKCISIISI